MFCIKLGYVHNFKQKMTNAGTNSFERSLCILGKLLIYVFPKCLRKWLSGCLSPSHTWLATTYDLQHENSRSDHSSSLRLSRPVQERNRTQQGFWTCTKTLLHRFCSFDWCSRLLLVVQLPATVLILEVASGCKMIARPVWLGL